MAAEDTRDSAMTSKGTGSGGDRWVSSNGGTMITRATLKKKK
jgi:hypothetical protein